MRGKQGYEHLNEPLHILVEAELPVEIVDARLMQAREILEDLLKPIVSSPFSCYKFDCPSNLFYVVYINVFSILSLGRIPGFLQKAAAAGVGNAERNPSRGGFSDVWLRFSVPQQSWHEEGQDQGVMDLIHGGLLELVCEISASKNAVVPMPQVLLCRTNASNCRRGTGTTTVCAGSKF